MPLYNVNGSIVLFIHVPKAGGTTIEFAMERYCIGLLDRTYNGRFFPCSPQHFHKDVLERTIDLSAINYSFMMVRHPLTRLQSEFRWRRKYHGVEADFERWALDALKRYHAYGFVDDNHLRPMVEFKVPNCEWFRLEDGLLPVYDRLQKLFPDMQIKREQKKAMVSDDEIQIVCSSRLKEFIFETYLDDFTEFSYEY